MKRSIFLFFLLLSGSITFAVNVTVTNPSNTTPVLSASYASLADAISALNSITAISGPVIFTCDLNGTETAPLGGYIINDTVTTSSLKDITIDGNGTTITAFLHQRSGYLMDAVFKLVGSDYITLKNFIINENPGNTIIAKATNNCTEFGIAIFHRTQTDGAQNNTIENNTITLSATYVYSIGIYATSMHSSTDSSINAGTATVTSGLNNYLRLYGNNITASYGISVITTPNIDGLPGTKDKGVEIGGTSATSGNVIHFGINTAASATWYGWDITPAGINYINGVESLIGNNTITSNSSTLPKIIGIGISGTAPGIEESFSNTIINNTVNVNSTKILYGIIFSYNVSNHLIYCRNNTITLTKNLSAIATNDTTTGIAASVTNNSVYCSGNTITINQTSTSSTASGPTNGIDLSNAILNSRKTVADSNNITITQNHNGGKFTGDVIGINGSAVADTGEFYANNIIIEQNAASPTVANRLTGIASYMQITNLFIGGENKGNNITIKQNITTGSYSTADVFYIYLGIGNHNSIKINDNHFYTTGSAIRSTGEVAAIYLYQCIDSAEVKNNNIDVSFISSYMTGIFCGPNTQNAKIHDNIISIHSDANKCTTLYGINVNGNNFSVSNNTFPSFGFTSVFNTPGSVSCIRVTNGEGDIFKNDIENISLGTSGTAGPVFDGITVVAGAHSNVYQNKIAGITTGCTGAAAISGIRIAGGLLNKIYNNIIGNFSTPLASSTVAQRGINITSTASSSVYVYFNTVYLSGSGGANFGTAALFHTSNATATIATLYLNNNILINKCTPSGTGLAVGLQRSAVTLANFNSGSNNNLIYTSAPSATTPTYRASTTNSITLASYKTIVSPRDALAVTEDVSFLSTLPSNSQFLHIDPATTTLAAGGAAVLTGYSTDYDDNGRKSTNPDIGADEFYNLLNPPVITVTPLANSCSHGDRIISNVLIHDVYGSPLPPSSFAPRVYYRKNSDAWHSSQGVNTSGSVPDLTWSFTIKASDMGTLTENDIISYYIIAQSQNGPVTSSPAEGLVATNVNNVTTPPTPYTTTVRAPLSGVYTVGNGQDFNTITDAIFIYNSGCIAGPVILKLTDPLYGPLETIPIALNSIGDVTNTLTIMPADGVVATITGSNNTGPVIDLNGADYITIDGVNTRGSSLTIKNTAVGSPTIRLTGDATHNTLKNCTVIGSSNTALGSAGGVVFFSTGISTGNDYNTISKCNIGPEGSNLPSKGIGSFGSSSSYAIANSNNTIDSCHVYDFFLSSGCAGIAIDAGNTEWNITNNKIYETQPLTFTSGGEFYGIRFNDPDLGQGINITGNTLGYANPEGTGTLTLLGNAQVGCFLGLAMVPRANATIPLNICSNTVSNISLASSTGHIYAIYNGIPGPISAEMNINNNIIRNISSTTTANIHYMIYAGCANTLNANGNTIDNISRTGNGQITGVEVHQSTIATISNNTISNIAVNNLSASNFIIGINDDINTGNYVTNNNNIYGFTTTSVNNVRMYGIYRSGTRNGNKECSGNDIHDFSAPAGATSMTGIRLNSKSTPVPFIVSNNKIHGFSGGNSIYGIYQSYGCDVNIFRNTIYDITATGNAVTIYGLFLGGGLTSNVYNNIITDLKTPSGSDNTYLSGIFINAGTTHNLSYNTVRLNATSTGSNFGNSCVNMTTSPKVTLLNNIFINNSTPKGNGIVCALKRSGPDLANYGSESDGNVFYAGLPAISNQILNSGTSYITISDFKTAVGPARDSLSRTGEVDWLSTSSSSPDFMHVDPSRQSVAESAGIPVTGITVDYDGESRSLTSPDAGADEFGGIYQECDPPVISFSVPDSICGTGDFAITGVHILDSTGIYLAPSPNVARLYYRKNSETWYSSQGNLVSGNSKNGIWDFPVTVSDMGGITQDDNVYCFVVAQDTNTWSNVGVYPSDGSIASGVNNVAGAPAVPKKIFISENLNGSYTVGTGGYFTSISAALNSLNKGCIAGPVVFQLTDTIYNESTGEVFPLVLDNNPRGGSFPFILTPPPGKNVTLSGHTNDQGLIRILRNNVTIDGSDSGDTSRNFTLTVDDFNSPSSISIESNGTTPVTDVTINNCNLSNPSGQAIIIADGEDGTGGYFNNINIQNNNINRANTGIAIHIAENPGNGTGVIVTGNLMEGSEINAISHAGIEISGADGALISSNVMHNWSNDSGDGPSGIIIGTGTKNSTISGNMISDIQYEGSDSVAPRGIVAATGTGIVNNTITGNTVSGLTSSGEGSGTPSGIYIDGEGYVVKNNTINRITSRDSIKPEPAYGLYLNSPAGASGMIVYNNFIADVTSNGDGNLDDHNNGYGIYLDSGSTFTFYYNSISQNANQHDPAGYPACLFISDQVTSAGSVNMVNNIFSITQTTGTERYSVQCNAPSEVFGNINYNDYYSTGPDLGYLGGNLTGLNEWKTATGKDSFSISGDPVFTSPLDLHIFASQVSPVTNAGFDLHDVITLDIDDQLRQSSPDIGADEFDPVFCDGAVGGSVSNDTLCGQGTPAISASGFSIGIGSTYQWQYSDDNFVTDIHDLTGETSPYEVSPGTVTSTTYYRLKVTCNTGTATAYSSAGIVIVRIAPTAAAASNSPVCEGNTLLLTGTSNVVGSFSWTGPDGYTSDEQNPEIEDITGAGEGTYTFTVTLNGCTNFSSVDVVVNPVPSINLSDDSIYFLQGDIVTFSENQSDSVVWFPLTYLFSDPGATIPYTGESLNEVYAQPPTSITYTATALNDEGCSISDEVVLTKVNSLQWNGSISNDWTEPGNWTPRFIPSSTTEVTILVGYNYEPIVNDTGLSCGNLILGSGTILTVDDSMDITVNGDLTVKTGASLQNLGDITVTGELVCE